jgi:hypothetical protein
MRCNYRSGNSGDCADLIEILRVSQSTIPKNSTPTHAPVLASATEHFLSAYPQVSET